MRGRKAWSRSPKWGEASDPVNKPIPAILRVKVNGGLWRAFTSYLGFGRKEGLSQANLTDFSLIPPSDWGPIPSPPTVKSNRLQVPVWSQDLPARSRKGSVGRGLGTRVGNMRFEGC